MTKIAALTSEDLAALGASESSIRWLTKPSARNIQYLDLIEPVGHRTGSLPMAQPSAVIEFEGQPLLYVVDNRSLANKAGFNNQEIAQTLRILACRGDPAYLVVMEYGQVVIYPIGLRKEKVPDGVTWDMPSMGRRSLVQDLVAGVVPGLPERDVRRAAVHDLLFRLLSYATDQLLVTRALRGRHDDVLALVGRALFARFLVDRAIMTTATFPALKGTPEECFADPAIAAKTCKWLDLEFNGELLPLAGAKYKTYFESMGKDSNTVLGILSNIMHRAPGGQLSFDSKWGDLDFAHVPIGLLSEVYERYAHRHVGKNASDESMHYTPRHIAEFMIEEAFEGLDRKHRHRARLLDPAAGGGVFLTLGFRKLVAETWYANKRRPSRQEIRKILYEQIRGFDINPSALKLAALGLYLTAIELDPDPKNLSGRSFHPLFAWARDADLKTVLTCARLPDEPVSNSYVLGSLGTAISRGHHKRYDIIISNPPWTGLSSKRGAKEIVEKFHGVVRGVARARAVANNQHPGLLEVADSYENPDGVPDMPFVWRSMEWSKDGGIIALALHARLLFKQADMGAKARDAVFTGLRVTGILNGSAVRKEKVWPNVGAQWCLLFARNEVPENHHLFHFVSIELEKRLNTQGRIRIDHNNAQPIQFSVLRGKPQLLKTLFRGTVMDATVMEYLGSLPTVRLKDYMASHGLWSGEGYQVYEEGNRKNASAMIGMLDLNRAWAPKFAVNTKTLQKRFDRHILHRPRDIEIYRGPLMIIPESLPERPDEGCGLISINDVAYTESFTGYSTSGFKGGDPEALARYLHVLTYSKLFQYHILMSSAKFGVERDTIQKEDVDDFPIVPFEKLSAKTVEQLQSLSKAIEDERSPWQEVDNLVFNIYSVSEHLRNVVADTLSVSLPYTSTNDRAQRPPTQKEVEEFRSSLEDHLRPLFEHAGIDLRVKSRSQTEGSWAFLDVICGNHQPPAWDAAWLKRLADDQGASRIFVQNPPHHIGVGMLAQYRYWTPSRAHLCALAIVRNYSNDLIAANTEVA
jgi:hypothetical protein